MPQLSQSGRIVRLVAVSKGNVYTAASGDTAWSTPDNNTGDTPPLNVSGIMFSSPCVEKLFFADGTNWVYYDPRTDSVERWSPSAGALPVDSLNNTPRLICTWRGRIVLSSLIFDPQNIFFSRVGVPTDFDYAPDDPDPTQAVALNLGPQGVVGDAVTALIAYTDDIMVIGCDHEIHLMSGDPADGGRIDRVSDAIGMAFGQAFAKDPFGTIYFVSNRMGIYTMVPGQLPQRISGPVEQLLEEIDTGNTVIRCLWDDAWQGMHFFFTYAVFPRPARHLFYEARTGAWWEEVFANDDHNPVCVATFDGNTAADRVALMGGWDGYVRAFSPDAGDDDGTPIDWEVAVGPLNTKDTDELFLKELQGVLGEDSGDVTFAVHSGRTAEAALAAAAGATGTWVAGRNTLSPVRRAGHAHYVKLSGRGYGAIEQVRCLIGPRGAVRRRGF